MNRRQFLTITGGGIALAASLEPLAIAHWIELADKPGTFYLNPLGWAGNSDEEKVPDHSLVRLLSAQISAPSKTS